MKISITYLPEEAQQAVPLVRLLLEHLPESKARNSDRHAPYKHIYLTTKKPANHCSSKEKA